MLRLFLPSLLPLSRIPRRLAKGGEETRGGRGEGPLPFTFKGGRALACWFSGSAATKNLGGRGIQKKRKSRSPCITGQAAKREGGKKERRVREEKKRKPSLVSYPLWPLARGRRKNGKKRREREGRRRPRAGQRGRAFQAA